MLSESRPVACFCVLDKSKSYEWVWEFVFSFSLCCFVYLFHLFYYHWMGICEGDFMVIAYEWWLDEIIHCLQEVDHRLGCFVSLDAVSHMLKMIMKPACHNDSVSVLKSHLFFCKFLACILVLMWGYSLWMRKRTFFFFSKINNAPFASCNVMYILNTHTHVSSC